jgi:hypothetical protein
VAAGVDAIYVFAYDHPDARNAAIDVMFEFTPADEISAGPASAPATRR